MSNAPGVTTIEQETAASGPSALVTDRSFIGGLSERGPVNFAVPVRSLEAFEATFGGAFAPGWLWNAARRFPLEGGSEQFYARTVGPAAKASSAKLKDGSNVDTIEVVAACRLAETDPGSWGDGIKVKTEVEGGNVIYIVTLNGDQIAKSDPLATNADAVAWSKGNAYFRLKDLGGADPKAQEVTLSGGTDDRASITDEHKAKTINDAFLRAFGAGQVAYPGSTTKAMREALAKHAKANCRIAVPDAVDTRTVATLTAATAELSSLDKEIRAASFKPFGPWITVEGEGDTTETLPPSILVMAAIARHDRETYRDDLGVCNPNDPAAGKNGILKTATGLTQAPWTDAERATLNETAINVIRSVNSTIRIYGYRTLAGEDKLLKFGNNRRIDMAILAKAEEIGEEFAVFGQMDGRGQRLGELAGAIRGEVLDLYYTVGALFGDSPSEAAGVDVGDEVNPVEQLAEGKARARIRARRSPAAEQIEIDYVKEEVA